MVTHPIPTIRGRQIPANHGQGGSMGVQWRRIQSRPSEGDKYRQTTGRAGPWGSLSPHSSAIALY